MHCSLPCSSMDFPGKSTGVGCHSQNIIQFYYYYFFVPGDSTGKEPACQCRRCKRWGFNPWVGKIPCGGGHNNLLQCSCQENEVDRGTQRVQSIGSQSFRHNCRDLAPISLYVFVTYVYLLLHQSLYVEEENLLCISNKNTFPYTC